MTTDSSIDLSSPSALPVAEALLAVDAPEVVTDPNYFKVCLDLFEGPVDLLLHLVQKNELPIEKLSLSIIAEQYFSCLHELHLLDLERAGEYVVIASTLLSIKSSILLNEPVEFVADDEGNLIDPQEELLRRIREAAVYKDGALKLAAQNILGIDVFPSEDVLKDIEAPDAGYKLHDAMLLTKAFKKLVTQAAKRGVKLEITVDAVSIMERMMTIVSRLQTAKEKFQKGVSFSEVILSSSDRAIIVSHFLAVLELCKRGMIAVKQDAESEEILLSLKDSQSSEIIAQQMTEVESEFDASHLEKKVV